MMSIDICCCWCWKERKNLWCYHFIENGNRNGVYILSMSCVCCKCGIHGIFNQMWHTWNAYAASTYIDFFIIMWNSKIFRSVNKAEAAAPNNISSFIPHPQHTIKSTTHSAHTHTRAQNIHTHSANKYIFGVVGNFFFLCLTLAQRHLLGKQNAVRAYERTYDCVHVCELLITEQTIRCLHACVNRFRVFLAVRFDVIWRTHIP